MPSNPTGKLDDGIGTLRWLVRLYRRNQIPADNQAIFESLTLLAVTHADIRGASSATYWGSVQVDRPTTNTVYMRWTDTLPNTTVIIRNSRQPTDGVIVSELYRVRRFTELGGRKRFVAVECELERYGTLSNWSDEPGSAANFLEGAP